jgi:hypothetical protein
VDIEQIILEQVAALARKLEDIASKIENRVERQARYEEQLKGQFRLLREASDGYKQELKELRNLIVGDGKDIGITAKIADLQCDLQTLEQAAKTSKPEKDVTLAETQGQWQVKVESVRGKFLVIVTLLTALTGLLGLVIEALKLLKGTPK